MKALIILLPLILTAGCAKDAYSLMKNPKTGELHECKADPWGDLNYGRQIRNCTEKYKMVGYEEVGAKE